MVMIVAHQGGWDEALFVATPIAVFAFLLHRAKRRAEAESAEGTPEVGSAPDRGET
jgi:hypothetical protein